MSRHEHRGPSGAGHKNDADFLAWESQVSASRRDLVGAVALGVAGFLTAALFLLGVSAIATVLLIVVLAVATMWWGGFRIQRKP